MPDRANRTSPYEIAFDQAYPHLLSLELPKLLKRNLDSRTVADTAIAVSHRVKFLREQVTQLAFFDMFHFDRLGTLGMALLHAIALDAQSQDDSLAVMLKEAQRLNAGLKNDLSSLIFHGAVDAAELPHIPPARSYEQRTGALFARATFLKSRWQDLAKTCGLQIQQIDAALALCEQLDARLGARRLKPRARRDAQGFCSAEVLHRAFTACVNSYGQTRRAVQYLRYEEQDADKLVPSLYSIRKSGRRAAHRRATAIEPPADSTAGTLDAELPASSKASLPRTA
jgi:hypothetical protein